MRVMIGVDGSDGGWEAVYQATRLLTAAEDQVALYYSPPRVAFRREAAPAGDIIARTQQSLSESILDEGIQRLPGALQAKAEKVVGQDDVKQGLKNAAESWQADLLAVGATGTGGLRGLLLGSVPRWLLRSTSMPLLVARKKADKASDPTYRVFMAVDEVPATKEPAELLNKFHWPKPSAGRLIHIVEPLFGAELPLWLEERAHAFPEQELAEAWVNEYQSEKRHKFDELSHYGKSLPTPFTGNPPVILEGNPADKIIESALADDVDLIVVGTRDMSKLERFMIGSTAEHLVQHAPCSVLVTHRPKS